MQLDEFLFIVHLCNHYLCNHCEDIEDFHASESSFMPFNSNLSLQPTIFFNIKNLAESVFLGAIN